MIVNLAIKQLDTIKDKLEFLSAKTNFIKRKVKLTEYNFLASLLTANQTNIMSDEMICNNLHEDYKIDIKRQSYNERLHKDESVAYLKSVFEQLLDKNNIYNEQEIDEHGITSNFHNIYIEDNTTISLHESMSEQFQGIGGSACNGAIKIYLNFIANKRQIADIQIFKGTTSDASLSNTVIDKLKPDDLVLRDLGFFKIKSFKAIMRKGAYFLSRYFLSTHIYIHDKKLDILDFIYSKKEFTILDESVYLSNEKLPVRLVVYKVSDEVYNQRVYNIRKAHNKKGKTPKKRTLKLQRYVMFVSNIDKSQISKEQLGTLYRLRWQVELVFKRWKSFMHIHIITTTSKKTKNIPNKKGGKISNRILCFIYAKLIAILLMTTIEYIAHALALERKRELSSDKFAKWILSRDRLQKLFIYDNELEKIYELLKQNIMRLVKDKRIKNPSTMMLLRQGVGFYENTTRMQRLGLELS